MLNLISSTVLAVYEMIIAYAITKHELMDIRVAITRSAAYVMVGLLIVFSFVAINLQAVPLPLVILTNSLLGLFWAMAAHRLRGLIQTPLEEKWITDWFDSDKLINQIATKLVPVMDRSGIFNTIAGELKAAIKIKDIKIAIGRPATNYQDLTQTKAGLVMPLSSSEGPEGLLILGPKISEDPYNDKDLTVLRTIIIQVRAIFDRVRPYEQIKQDYDANQKKLYDTERLLARSERIASMASLIQEYNHEIRTPLNVMSTFLGSLPDDAKAITNIMEVKDKLMVQIRRAADIVDSTLRLSQPKERKEVPLNLNDVINDALKLYQPIGINLIKELNDLPLISGDYEDLKLVFINLVKNAREAIQANGEIKIRTYPVSENGANCVCSEVADSGAGILKENIEKIFEPFFSTHVTKGRGLGLSIVFRIVREHLGSISVKSEPGQGSLFTVSLPVRG